MTPYYDVPGVYIEEVTGPGVIAGVSTSTAAFIGPTIRGPLKQPRRVSSFDEYIELYGETRAGRPWPYLFVEGRPYYMAFGVEGFFTNGGRQAYILRIGTAEQAEWVIKNQNQAGAEDVFVVRALQDGAVGNDIQVETQMYGRQDVATGKASITAGAGGSTVTVDTPDQFQVDDLVSDGATQAKITGILGNVLTLDGPTGNSATELRIADLERTQNRVRMGDTASLYPNGRALITGDNAATPGTLVIERVVIQSVDDRTHTVTLAAAGPTITSGAATITVTVSPSGRFRVGDLVTTDGKNRAQIKGINPQGDVLTLDLPLVGASDTNTLLIAGTPPGRKKTYNLDTAAAPFLTSIRVVAHGKASVTGSATTTNPTGNTVTAITVNYPLFFRPGDIVTSNGPSRADRPHPGQCPDPGSNPVRYRRRLAHRRHQPKPADLPRHGCHRPLSWHCGSATRQQPCWRPSRELCRGPGCRRRGFCHVGVTAGHHQRL